MYILPPDFIISTCVPTPAGRPFLQIISHLIIPNRSAFGILAANLPSIVYIAASVPSGTFVITYFAFSVTLVIRPAETHEKSCGGFYANIFTGADSKDEPFKLSGASMPAEIEETSFTVKACSQYQYNVPGITLSSL